REAKEKKEPQDRYWKMHVTGNTDQAKVDLGHLAMIKAEREAAQANATPRQKVCHFLVFMPVLIFPPVAKAAESAAKQEAATGRR
ncbi:hypothetical protein CPB85DRAFT_1232188, partial [Mucidula mucida]